METYDDAEASERSGVKADGLGRLVRLGLLTADAEKPFAPRVHAASRGPGRIPS